MRHWNFETPRCSPLFGLLAFPRNCIMGRRRCSIHIQCEFFGYLISSECHLTTENGKSVKEEQKTLTTMSASRLWLICAAKKSQHSANKLKSNLSATYRVTFLISQFACNKYSRNRWIPVHNSFVFKVPPTCNLRLISCLASGFGAECSGNTVERKTFNSNVIYGKIEFN